MLRLVGLAMSRLVYLLLSRPLDVRAGQPAIEASERALRLVDEENSGG